MEKNEKEVSSKGNLIEAYEQVNEFLKFLDTQIQTFDEKED